MYSIAQTHQGSKMFYNFQKNQIEWAIYMNKRNEDHFCDDISKVFEICEKMQIAENSKNWGYAKPIYLYKSDKLIKVF